MATLKATVTPLGSARRCLQYKPKKESNESVLNLFVGIGLLIIATIVAGLSFVANLTPFLEAFLTFFRIFSIVFILFYVIERSYSIMKGSNDDNSGFSSFFTYLFLVLGVIFGLIAVLVIAVAPVTSLASMVAALLTLIVLFFNIIEIWNKGTAISTKDLLFMTLIFLTLLVGVIVSFTTVPVIGIAIVIVLVLEGLYYLFSSDNEEPMDEDSGYAYLPAIFALLSLIAAAYIFLNDNFLSFPWNFVVAVPNAGN